MLTAEVNQTKLPQAARLSRRAIEVILKEIARQAKVSGGVSIAFVTEQEIRAANRVYRKRDKVTDVLAFEAPLYEIIICYSEAKRQAKERGHTVKQEVIDLIIHGVLHAFGFDHERSNDAKVMLPLQQKIYERVADC